MSILRSFLEGRCHRVMSIATKLESQARPLERQSSQGPSDIPPIQHRENPYRRKSVRENTRKVVECLAEQLYKKSAAVNANNCNQKSLLLTSALFPQRLHKAHKQTIPETEEHPMPIPLRRRPNLSDCGMLHRWTKRSTTPIGSRCGNC